MDIRRELYEWFKNYKWDVAATMTFSDEIGERKALKLAKRFWDEVDYGLYRNASRRFNKRCQRVVMLEGNGEGVRYHLHAAILTPGDRFSSTEVFCDYLERRWLKQNPSSFKVEFKPTWDADGWSWYVTKQSTRFQCDRFDVHSSHIAAPNLLTVS